MSDELARKFQHCEFHTTKERVFKKACAPSYLTSQVFYVHARNLLRHHKGDVTPRVKKEILDLLDRALEIHIIVLGGNDM